MSGNKICILGDAESFWIQRYIENVCLPLGWDICVVTQTNEKYKDYFRRRDIKVYTTAAKGVFRNIRGISGVITACNTLLSIMRSKAGRLNVQFASEFVMKFLSIFRIRKEITITYWGSDLLRMSINKLTKYRKVIDQTNNIVVMTPEMKTYFHRIYDFYPVNQIHIIDMGNSEFDMIDKYRCQKGQLRKQLYGNGIDEKKVIVIGYNAIIEQQHDKVLTIVSHFNKEIRKKIHLVLLLTYGRSDLKYIEKVKKLAVNTGCSYSFFETFLSEEEMAKIAVTTDIFINVQTTDALSETLKEQLYAGSYVISGEWLKYGVLEEMGINYQLISQLNELEDKMIYAIEKEEKDELNANSFKLKERFSWDKCRENWCKLIDAI